MQKIRIASFLSIFFAHLGAGAFAAVDALEKKDVAELALAHALEVDAITINAVAAPGRNGDVVAYMERLGGRVVYRFDKADFFAAVIPIDRVAEAMAAPALVSADFEPQINLRGMYTVARMHGMKGEGAPGPADGEGAASISTPPSLESLPPFPLDAEHTVLDDLNAREWREANPAFDGRGVVIAHIEHLPDPLAPELQVAYDLEGRPVPKIIDVVVLDDYSYGLTPEEDIPDWGIAPLGAPQTPTRGRFDLAGKSYAAPADGPLQIGVLPLPNRYLSTYSQDLIDPEGKAKALTMHQHSADDRSLDLPTEIPSTHYAFAWRASDQTLWFDRDRDGAWTDETPVRPFKASRDLIVLGDDDPATPKRESIAMIFQVSEDGRSLLFNLAYSDHATMVAGSAAASKGAAGRLDGVAPGAQLLPIRVGTSVTSFARAMIAGFSDPRSDIVLIEGRSSVTDPNNIVEGRTVLGYLTQRLVEIYDKPALATAGNYPGVSKIKDICVSADAICVGAYQSGATTRLMEGVDMGVEHSLHWVGSSGPATNGAVKPDFLAPSNIATLRMPAKPFMQPAGLYRPVYGYQVGGGTSNAAPVAVGAAALIISAAKQEGLPHGAKAINRALRSSAHFIESEDVKAYQQGRGVIDVAAAWRALETASGAAPLELDVAADVNTVHSKALSTPHQGVGLFEREGWSAGDRGRRTLTLTRRNGPDRPVRYQLELRGDKTTFSAPKSVRLPLNRPVEIDVDIHVERAGAHSALMVLTRKGREDTLAEIGLNVFVPEPLNDETDYRAKETASLRVGERRAFFARVPEGADGLWIRGTSAPEQFRPPNAVMSILSPSNSYEFLYGYSTVKPYYYAAGAVMPAPAQGAWEMVAVNQWAHVLRFDWSSAGKVAPEKQIDLDLAIIDAEIDYDRAKGVARIVNRAAALYGGLATSPAASLRQENGRLAPHAHKAFDIDVEPGAELLVAEVAVEDGVDFDADLHLYYCEESNDCRPMRHGRTYGGKERVIVDRPAAGRWKAVIVSYGASGAPAPYQYKDYWTHPKFGVLASSDTLAPRESGAVWSAIVTRAPAQASPGMGRTLADVLYLEAPQYVSAHTTTARTDPQEPNLDNPFRKNDTFLPVGLAVIPR